MAYKLVGKQGDFTLRESDFPQLLRLGIFYGWEPEGTGAPDHIPRDEWNSREYLNCEGQYVHDTDARKLCRALKSSLRDIPEREFQNESQKCPELKIQGVRDKKREKSLLNLIKYFSGNDKRKIEEFIEYIQRGGFKIF
jgi:hypothetical protein